MHAIRLYVIMCATVCYRISRITRMRAYDALVLLCVCGLVNIHIYIYIGSLDKLCASNRIWGRQKSCGGWDKCTKGGFLVVYIMISHLLPCDFICLFNFNLNVENLIPINIILKLCFEITYIYSNNAEQWDSGFPKVYQIQFKVIHIFWHFVEDLNCILFDFLTKSFTCSRRSSGPTTHHAGSPLSLYRNVPFILIHFPQTQKRSAPPRWQMPRM